MAQTNHNYKTKAGYVAIVGRPNVGKSTLLNKILGQKVSITSRKPQTTRHKILGIKTHHEVQAIYVDTPGIHDKNEKMLNQYMNQAALSVFADVDLIIFVVAGTIWHQADEVVLQALHKTKLPVILVINKTDLVTQKEQLLEHIQMLNRKFNFATIIPTSAASGTNVAKLEEVVSTFLPPSPWYFPEEQFTDRDQKFLLAEMVREKLMRCLGQELPYALAVMIDQITEKEHIIDVNATIYVERDGQKVIIVGKNGAVLKKVGTLARQEMENLLHKKVFLRLWVKVKSSWTDKRELLQQFGYD